MNKSNKCKKDNNFAHISIITAKLYFPATPDRENYNLSSNLSYNPLMGIMNWTQITLKVTFVCIVFIFFIYFFHPDSASATLKKIITKTSIPSINKDKAELYRGKIYHIFFHSLVIYPELAFQNDKKGKAYRTYMVTQKEFENILLSLYKNQFVLINIHSIYSVSPTGEVSAKAIYLPRGKKPLILSLDDLSYYTFMKGRGFANKLVLDKKGNVATEVVTPKGKKIVTRDGDVVPILDDFIAKHPDFSINGAKGIIGLTGFEGILGYRTENQNDQNYAIEISGAKVIVNKLKSSGWEFADHSYSHDTSFTTNTINLSSLQTDTEKWKREVESLVGKTDIFIGPFGQIFKQNDARQKYLIAEGFKILCGVGVDLYLRYYTDHVVMDRANIDGYRLTKTPELLKPYFNPKLVIDPARN